MAPQNSPILTDFSHELLCHILQYLPLKKVLSISMLCKKLRYAVDMHLRLCKEIDLCEGKIYDYMPSTITDDHMHALLKRCPHLEAVYGLHPLKVERRRLRKRSALTVPGIIEALCLCCNLKSVETSDLRLLEAIMHHLPQVDIIGHFQNRDGVFPPHASQRLKLLPYPRISSLHLIGVEVPELTAMPHLHHLHLQCVRFTKLQPFRAFLAQNLKTFVMKHCMGPSLSLRYLSLIIALSSSPSLTRLELVRVPLPGGLFQRAVEDSYRHNGFVNLKTLVISGCKGVLESDLGHLMIVSSKNLESISIQPSLTRDSLFVSLSFANCEFPKLKSLHLGYVDKLNAPGEWTNDTLLSIGLADIPDTPSSLTDSGMKVISQLFPNIKRMSVSNCPHLMAMDQWSAIDGEQQVWKELNDLTLQRCHCLQLPSFALFLAFLPKIEVVILNDMFREPPKGCSHVGLSAGTGLGMSSAVVSNQDEHIAVQGHHQEFELHPDDPLDNEAAMEDEFIDVDNMENPDQHIMVLQQEFFDEENQIARVAQREDILPVGNVPENQIRRELNADYRAEEGSESSDASPLSTSDDEGSLDKRKMGKKRNLCYVRKMNRKKRKKYERYHFTGFSSEEEHAAAMAALPPSKKVTKKGKAKRGNCGANSQASTRKGIEKDCRHDKKCQRNCSKGFDPNKPSTSKDGNCLDCRCADDSELKEPLGAEPKVHKRSRVSSSSDGEPIRKKSNLNTAASCNSDLCSEKVTDENGEKCNSHLTRDHSEMVNSDTQEAESLNQSIISQNTEQSHENERCTAEKGETGSNPFTKDHSEMFNSFAQEPESLNQYDIEHIEKIPEDEGCADEKDESCSPLNRDCSEMLNSHAQDPESLNHSIIENTGKLPTKDKSTVEKSEQLSSPLAEGHRELLSISAQEPESLNRYNPDHIEKKPEDKICVYKEDEIRSPLTRDHSEMLNSHILEPESLNHSNIEHVEKKPRDEIFIDEKGESCSPGDPSSEVLISDIQKPESSNQFNIDHTMKKSADSLIDERDENYDSLTKDQNEVLHLGSEEPESFNVFNAEESDKNIKADSICDQNESSNGSSIECNKQKALPISEVDSNCEAKDSNIIAVKDVGIIFDFPGRIKSEPDSLPSSPQKYPMDVEDESIELNKPNYQNIACELPVEIAHGTELAPSPSIKDILPVEMMECGTLNDSITNNDCSVEMESEPELDVSSQKDHTGSVENVSMECAETIDAIMSCDIPLVEMEVNTSQVEHAAKDNSEKDQCLGESEPLSSIPPSDKQTASQDAGCCETNDLDMSCEPPLVEESPAESVSELRTEVLVNKDESSEQGLNGKQTIGCNPAVKESPSESFSILQTEVLVSEHKSSEHGLNGKQTIGCNPAVNEPAESSSNLKEIAQDQSVPTGTLFDDRVKENPQVPNFCSEMQESNCEREEKKTIDSSTKRDPVEAFESRKSKEKNDQSNSCKLSPEAKSNSPIQETIVVQDDSMEDYKPNDHNYCSLDVEIKSEPESVPSPSSHIHPDMDEPRPHHSRDSELSGGFLGPVRIKSEPESLPPSPRGEVDDQEAGPSRQIDPENLEQIINAEVKAECESADDSSQENNVEPELPTRRQNHTRIIDCHCCFEIKSECESADSSPENADSATKKNATESQAQGEPSAACSCSPQVKTEAESQTSSVQEEAGNDKKTQTPRKRNPPRICKRASRALTKKQRRRIGRSGYNLVSQGTQATSADIRRSLRRVKGCLRRTNPDSTGTAPTTPTVRYSRVSCRQVIKRKPPPKPNVITHNKSTSTSDPLMEDDAVQTLRLVSETLISLTIISCGISDVVIDHCHSLTHVEVQACRILKMFQLHYCPALKRIGISQCPKLMLESITPEVVSLVATRKMIIYYEPCMQKYSSPRCEKAVFSKTPLDQGIILFQDYTRENNESQQAAFKEYLFKWMEVVQKLYYSPLLAKQKKKKTKPKEIKSKFPYGHNLIRLHGVYTLPRSIDPIGTTWRYQILTNDHVFASALEKVPWDKGFPPPDIAEDYREDSALLSMIETELHEKNLKTQKKLTTFYIPTYENTNCDL